MSNYLIYVLEPLFPNHLWTSIEIQCRHVQDHIRSSCEVGSALGLGQGPWASPGGAAQYLSPGQALAILTCRGLKRQGKSLCTQGTALSPSRTC